MFPQNMFRFTDAKHVIFSSFPIAQFNLRKRKIGWNLVLYLALRIFGKYDIKIFTMSY